MKIPKLPLELVIEPGRFPQIQFISNSVFETKPQHINIGYCGPTGEHEAFARYIVTAVNAHEDLVTALQAMCGDGVHGERESLVMSRAALAKAAV